MTALSTALLIVMILATCAVTVATAIAMYSLALSSRKPAGRTEYPMQTETIRYERTVTTSMPAQQTPAALTQQPAPVIVFLPTPNTQQAPQLSARTDLDIWRN